MWENVTWYGDPKDIRGNEDPDLEFLWPLEMVNTEAAYTQRELIAWKQQYVEGNAFSRVVYARLSLEGVGKRVGWVRRVWSFIKLFSPLIALAVMAHFFSPAPVVVLSCVILPIQLILVGLAIHRTVYEWVIGAFVRLERENQKGGNGRG